MSATATKTQEVLQGIFESADESAAFLGPLNDIKSTSPSIIIHFNSDKTIAINAINSGRNLITMMEYDASVLEKFDVPKDFEFGITELAEFYNLANLFTDGFSVKLSDRKIELESEGQKFTYYAAQKDLIKEGPSSLEAKLTWYSEFEWNPEEFDRFRRALGTIKHNYVILEGKKGEKTLSMSITDKDVRTSSYRYEVDLVDPNVDDFKTVISKDTLIPVVNSSVKRLNVQISDRVISLSGKGENHQVKYYISAAK